MDSELEEVLTDAEALLADGFEDALIGSCVRFGQPTIALYDLDKCIKILMRDGASYEKALEYFEYNTLGAWMGDSTPAFARLSPTDPAPT